MMSERDGRSSGKVSVLYFSMLSDELIATIRDLHIPNIVCNTHWRSSDAEL